MLASAGGADSAIVGTWRPAVDPGDSDYWRERALDERRAERRLEVQGLAYAGVALRFVAVLIDLLVLVLLTIPVGLLTGGGYAYTEHGNAQAGVTVDSWWAVALWLGYYVGCEALFGRTLGKRAVGLRVIREDGTPAALGAALVRNLFRFPVLFYLVAAIAVWTSPTKQRIGDRVAGTFVVKA